MATNSRLAREQCEKAFAAYLIAQKVTPPAWSTVPSPLTANGGQPDVPVFIRKGQLDASGIYHLDKPDDVPLPSICIAVPRVKPHVGMDYPVCELNVLVLSSIDEDDVNARHSARVGFISELFDESHQAELFQALNLGNVNRTVHNFNIFGMYLTEEMGEETGRHWIDHFVYECHAQPTDDVNGDSQD